MAMAVVKFHIACPTLKIGRVLGRNHSMINNIRTITSSRVSINPGWEGCKIVTLSSIETMDGPSPTRDASNIIIPLCIQQDGGISSIHIILDGSQRNTLENMVHAWSVSTGSSIGLLNYKGDCVLQIIGRNEAVMDASIIVLDHSRRTFF